MLPDVIDETEAHQTNPHMMSNICCKVSSTLLSETAKCPPPTSLYVAKWRSFT
uniref:Uncharacterized protein n=1 Tax=Arundo donax TaxID=35708 RepID=A0A0A8YQ86_ARUDO